MMKIAVVTPWPVDDPRAWSGVIAPMIDSLRQRFDVVPWSTKGVRDSFVDRAATRLLDGVAGKRYIPGHALATATKRGRKLTAALEMIRPDAVLAVAASQDIAFLSGEWPVVQVSDLTFQSAGELYPDFQKLWPISRWQGAVLSGRSVQRTARTLAATDWVKDRLVHDDGIDPKDIVVAPFGPGIEPPADALDERGPGEDLRILSVVSNWHRKGGDRILAVHRELLRRGVKHELTIAGECHDCPDSVRALGRVSPDQLRSIYASHDILLEPARGNASGITLTDAANFGLVAVATNTGGVATIIRDGETGILVADRDDETLTHEAADAVESIASRAGNMGAAARAYAAEKLNWEAWGESAAALLREAVG